MVAVPAHLPNFIAAKEQAWNSSHISFYLPSQKKKAATQWIGKSGIVFEIIWKRKFRKRYCDAAYKTTHSMWWFMNKAPLSWSLIYRLILSRIVSDFFIPSVFMQSRFRCNIYEPDARSAAGRGTGWPVYLGPHGPHLKEIRAVFPWGQWIVTRLIWIE